MSQHTATNKNNKKPNYFAVILSAGQGSRFGADMPKQYLPLAGKRVIEHSVQTILSTLLPKETIITHAQGDDFLYTLSFSLPIQFVLGGQERMHSVFHALLALKEVADEDDYVLIHDGARPCVTSSDICKLVDMTKEHAVGGVLATPVTNTIKKANEDMVIQETIPRQQLWAVQTPQLLRFGLLYDALDKAIKNNLHVTDDASALELQEYYPLIVQGSSKNIKITYPDDLQLAEWYLSRLRHHK